jgi:hypothetical protein
MTAFLATLYHSILCDYCLFRAEYSRIDHWVDMAEYHLKTLFAIEQSEVIDGI